MTRSSIHTLSTSSALHNNAFLQELDAVFEPENIFQKIGLIVEARSKNWYLNDDDTGYNEEDYVYDSRVATPVPGTQLESELGSLQSIASFATLGSLPASPVLASCPLKAVNLTASPVKSRYPNKKSAALTRKSAPLQHHLAIGHLTTIGHFLLSMSAICAAEAFGENTVYYPLAVLSYLALNSISWGTRRMVGVAPSDLSDSGSDLHLSPSCDY